MAAQIIQGHTPAGFALLDVSPNGANELTPVTVEAEVRRLVFDVPILAGQNRVRLQWHGVEDQAFDAAEARPLPEGPVEIEVAGWSADGPTFYLSAPVNTPVPCSVHK